MRTTRELFEIYSTELGGNAMLDGLIGRHTLASVREFRKVSNEDKVWKCPNCGGNETEFKNGKRICAYCHSEITGRTNDIKDVISVPAITIYEEV